METKYSAFNQLTKFLEKTNPKLPPSPTKQSKLPYKLGKNLKEILASHKVNVTNSNTDRTNNNTYLLLMKSLKLQQPKSIIRNSVFFIDFTILRKILRPKLIIQN